MSDEAIDVLVTLKRFQERVQRLETEIQAVQKDLDKAVSTLSQPVTVYEMEGEQIVVTQADVESVRTQLHRSHPETAVRVLALVNKIEATRTIALSKGLVITDPMNLTRWTFTWGLFVFFYASIWLIILVASFFYIDPTSIIGEVIESANVVWFAALAGGIGGVVSIFYSLSHVSLRREFDRQYIDIVYYLIKPVVGIVIGVVVQLIVTVGFLILGSDDNLMLDTRFAAITILLSWVAGFRQRAILFLIDRISQNIIPKTKSPGEQENLVNRKEN